MNAKKEDGTPPTPAPSHHVPPPPCVTHTSYLVATCVLSFRSCRRLQSATDLPSCRGYFAEEGTELEMQEAFQKTLT